MEHFNYDDYIVSLLLNNDDIYVKIKNNITLQHFESKITTDLIKFNHLTLNGLFKIIKKCLLKENENYKILFINNDNIYTMVVNINNDDLYEIKEEFIIKEIKLSTNNTNLLLNEKFNELQKQVNDIQTENITLKIKNINLQQEINNLQDCKFYIKVDNLISKTINDINQLYKNNVVLINTNNIDDSEIFIGTSDINLYNEIQNNNFNNLICKTWNKYGKSKPIFIIIYNYLNIFKNYFIKGGYNNAIFNNINCLFNLGSETLNIVPRKILNFLKTYGKKCYCKKIHKNTICLCLDFDFLNDNGYTCLTLKLCKKISDNTNNFVLKLENIFNDYVNQMIELYR
jgi:hypothetical protein